jgi:hypothetical protein
LRIILGLAVWKREPLNMLLNEAGIHVLRSLCIAMKKLAKRPGVEAYIYNPSSSGGGDRRTAI